MLISKFLKKESGSTTTEYAMIAALIAIAVFAALEVTAAQANAAFRTVNASLTSSDGPTVLARD